MKYVPIIASFLLWAPFNSAGAEELYPIERSTFTDVAAKASLLPPADLNREWPYYFRLVTLPQAEGDCQAAGEKKLSVGAAAGSKGNCTQTDLYFIFAEYDEYPEYEAYLLGSGHDWKLLDLSVEPGNWLRAILRFQRGEAGARESVEVEFDANVEDGIAHHNIRLR